MLHNSYYIIACLVAVTLAQGRIMTVPDNVTIYIHCSGARARKYTC